MSGPGSCRSATGAGWYTYALLDNAGYESARTILPEYQDLAVGDWVPMSKTVNETTAWKVALCEPGRALLLVKPDSTWSWCLDPLEHGGTRLVCWLKQRYRWSSPAMALFTLVLLEFGDFPMVRWMLLGIKARAEQTPAQPGENPANELNR